MSIDKITRSNDPHEPEGSGRKMRDVGDQFKRIERTGEVDPENRKKQKWENPNDSPMDLPKKTSFSGSSNFGNSDPYETHAARSKGQNQGSSSAPNPSRSNPYESAPTKDPSSQNNSSNSPPEEEKRPEGNKQSEPSKEKKFEAKKGGLLPGTFIEGDAHLSSRSSALSSKGPKSPLDPAGKPKEKSSDTHPNKALVQPRREHVSPHKESMLRQDPTPHPNKEKLHESKEGRELNQVDAQSNALEQKAEHKQKKGRPEESSADKAPSLDINQKAIQPPKAPDPIHSSGAAPTSPSVSSQLSHPEVARLFTQLVSHLTATASKGIKEVTITLSSGTFKGSQIILTETSTALRNYNIQLLGATREASALFAAHASELMEAFQAKPFPFKVNRIDSGHLIRRKEDIGKEDSNDENQE